MSEWITITETAKRLGVHRNTVRSRIKRWNLHTRRNPLNLNETLLDWSEIEQRLQEFEEPRGKSAA